MTKVPQYKRVERKRQMIYHIADRYERGGKLHTAYSLPKAIDMARSKHFRSILNELVAEGVIRYELVEHRTGVPKKLYYPDYDRLKELYPGWEKELRGKKKERQKIKLNGGGEQLEMFADWRK